MTQTTKTMIIALAVAAVLIAGSVTAIALTDSDDSGDDGDRSALADILDGERPLDDLLGPFLERFADGSDGEGLPPGVLEELLRVFGSDLLPPGSFEPPRLDEDKAPKAPKAKKDEAPKDKAKKDEAPKDEAKKDEAPKDPKDQDPNDDSFRDRTPRDGVPGDDSGRQRRPRFAGPRFDFGLPIPGFDRPRDGGFPFTELLEEFLADGRISPDEADELRRLFSEGFAGGFFDLPAVPDQPFAVPDGALFGLPFGDLPFGEFFADGRISPEEARELERLVAEGFSRGIFSFEFAPPDTDRAFRDLPQGLLDGLAGLPFREFFSDRELTSAEQEALRNALNSWLDGVFERFPSASG